MTAKEKRYKELLQATRKVMAEKGYEKTTIDDIVKIAGVAKGTFYLYFPSKMDTVIALATAMQKDIVDRVEMVVAGMDVGEDIFELISATAFDVMGEYRDVLPLFNTVSTVDTARVTMEEEVRAPYYEFVRELIKEGQAAGKYTENIDVEVMAQLIIGMGEHAAHDYYVYSSAVPLEAYLRNMNYMIRATLKK